LVTDGLTDGRASLVGQLDAFELPARSRSAAELDQGTTFTRTADGYRRSNPRAVGGDALDFMLTASGRRVDALGVALKRVSAMTMVAFRRSPWTPIGEIS
jgi:hypothetical protein